MSQQLGNYYDCSENIKELKIINAETKQRIKSLREDFLNINTEEIFSIELKVNKTRTHASGIVSIIKNYKKL